VTGRILSAGRINRNVCVVDPHHFDADPDSTYHPDADPDSDFFYADPDPTFHPDADPEPDPDLSFLIKAQTLKKVLK
jgi:hypothetical protein